MQALIRGVAISYMGGGGVRVSTCRPAVNLACHLLTCPLPDSLRPGPLYIVELAQPVWQAGPKPQGAVAPPPCTPAHPSFYVGSGALTQVLSLTQESTLRTGLFPKLNNFQSKPHAFFSFHKDEY